VSDEISELYLKRSADGPGSWTKTISLFKNDVYDGEQKARSAHTTYSPPAKRSTCQSDKEKRFEDITVQSVIDPAGVGRSAF